MIELCVSIARIDDYWITTAERVAGFRREVGKVPVEATVKHPDTQYQRRDQQRTASRRTPKRISSKRAAGVVAVSGCESPMKARKSREKKGELEELGGVLGGSAAGALALGGRHKPEELATLAAKTRFTTKEIQLIYRGFKQECPTGLVDEEAFKQIFSQFFPQGDASQYAHYVFNTMKRKASGKISFEEFLTILSKVSRGSVEEKLQWVFGLYDLDGDGLISKEEMLDVVGSIYEMLGRYTQPQIVEPHLAAREHVDRIFHLMDANKDGVVTIEELVQWCCKNEQLLQSLETLDTVL